jgi:putative membrane protein
MKTHLPHSLSISLAAAGLALAGAAWAQQAGGVSPAAPTAPAASVSTRPVLPASGAATGGAAGTRSLAKADLKFMKTAAQGGVAEVQSAEMAVSQGTHQQVKSFGQQMASDHGTANQELMTLASAKGVALPAEPAAKQKKAMARLKATSGAAFDRAYAAQMVKDHEQTLALFRKAAGSAQDPDVKAFAVKTVPTLEHHLQMAQSMQAAVK